MIVLDANAAASMAFHSTEGTALRMLMMKGEACAAPQLFYSEVVHTFIKYIVRGDISVKDALTKCEYACNLVDEFYEDQLLWTEALSESMRLQHSSYGMFYFVLARRLGATLVTLDKKLQALCDREGVDCIHSIKLPNVEE